MKKSILFLLVFPALLFFTSCADYGKKASKGPIEVFYKAGITEEQAQQTANFLHNLDISSNNDTTIKKSVQLTKENDTINFRMVVDKEKIASMSDFNFLALGNILSDTLFNHAPINVVLTDKMFKTIRTLHYKKLDFSADQPQP